MAALVAPDVRHRVSFLAAMAEFVAEGRAGGPSSMGCELAEWADRWSDEDGFAAYVHAVRCDTEEDAPRPAGFVPSTTLWWVDGSTYVGRIAVRHRLTPHLREVGGHIGYDVRSSARRLGHATAMLAAVLPVAAGLGIDPALLTSDSTNVASRKVIESAGGVLEDQRADKLRYWVSTSR